MLSITQLISLLVITISITASPIPEPGLISGTVGSLVGSVPAIIEANCNAAYTSCTASMSGEIENLLADGSKWTGKSVVNGWINNGVAYGNATLAGTAPAPFKITCNASANVCNANLTASATVMFSNGKQIQAWGWLAPSGHCDQGTCKGSITMSGDPYYKE